MGYCGFAGVWDWTPGAGGTLEGCQCQTAMPVGGT